MPPTLGQRLKHAREKRGLSLVEIAHCTKIPVRRLQDLEDDNLTRFGSLTYARSFLRSYADFLGVNADEVLGRMSAPPLGGARDYKYLLENHGPWIGDKDERTAMAPVTKVTAARSFTFAAVLCLACGLLIGAVMLGNTYFNGTENTAVEPVTVAGTTEPATTPVVVPVPSPAPPSEPSNLSPDAFKVPEPLNKPTAPVPKALPVQEKAGTKGKRSKVTVPER
jgi:transcriptional regulator with XRE-family HTH domain